MKRYDLDDRAEIASLRAAQADLQRQLAEAREALSRSKRLRDQYREALDAERNHSNPARITALETDLSDATVAAAKGGV